MIIRSFGFYGRVVYFHGESQYKLTKLGEWEATRLRKGRTETGLLDEAVLREMAVMT